MTTPSSRPPLPVLLYDGDCGFCTRGIELAVAHLDVWPSYQPFQTADLAAYGVSEAEAAHSVHWVDARGRISAGAAASCRLLVAAGGGWALLGRLGLVPPLSWVAEVAYRLVTRVRHRLPGTTPALQRPPGERPGA